MTNHQPIINPLFVIINLTGFAFLSLELFFETLLSIWPANHQLIVNLVSESIDKNQEFIEGEAAHALQ
jgi:hypothetical protein